MARRPEPGLETAAKMWDAAALLAEINHAYGDGVHHSWNPFELRVTAQLLEARHAAKRAAS
ncbi:hypothetical protein [Mycobacteroides chelonae]|uniref:hypothetical protein n=1 Tax=Mycobacteroides chelonae TaxID=1774 RepID=UPI0008A89A25|nr:hypothetical protein [Mycobacteroides chelonae]OHU48140.1 hypothetical protein BKG81_11405 [Mycobacteroides chelonae]